MTDKQTNKQIKKQTNKQTIEINKIKHNKKQEHAILIHCAKLTDTDCQTIINYGFQIKLITACSKSTRETRGQSMKSVPDTTATSITLSKMIIDI